ncbi:peptide chain release factor N(5)-glutamine methyltransferase [Prauserella sp. PE36]|uniref:Release factor glutamine methyltransferase n=1 Tax=Prauserella endophytica TaxID=1592324 RepID=A0ABY2RYR9_9PSEU|nr:MULTISPECIES: peptide chain release factor N(5)-glutamine methyltransferase [Prauserella]PXY26755.1 protein-(glutamine-N5) methyltransferase, release factor-specific [Prauserella coralliicola]RBM16562.1 peptide chain release factor N(5)-glutamine methyltransferase [Prauserella sp. PE36]TKG66156.1 peptide chain release factor N(5)-glutamine methyltransferase [Prauserella endophytica]
MNRQPLRLAILEATRILDQAGVASPRTDAELIAAHVLGVERGRLPLVPLVDPSVVEAIGQLVSQRAKRVPLQHLTGWAALGDITVSVGSGVFVPRPETELLLEWGLKLLKGREYPVVVDLCTGSGALALAVANARPDAVVYAVDNDTNALAWARHNADARAAAGDTPIRLYSGDVTDPTVFAELDGLVDLVLCNPPYVPEGTPVPPEVADHDPPQAVFAAEGGIDVIRHVVATAARLLRPGGGVAIEHDDTHGAAVPALLRARRVLKDVRDHPDLSGRPRFVTALRG